MKNTEIQNFVPDHVKTKKMCNNWDKELPFVLRYVPDLYKTQRMYGKVILEKWWRV